MPLMHGIDPLPKQIGERCEVLRPGQPLGLEPPHLAGRGSLTHWRFATDDPTHRWVAAQPLGVVHVLVAGQPPEYRLPQQPDQKVASVLAGARLRQYLATACSESKNVVQLAIGKKS